MYKIVSLLVLPLSMLMTFNTMNVVPNKPIIGKTLVYETSMETTKELLMENKQQTIHVSVKERKVIVEEPPVVQIDIADTYSSDDITLLARLTMAEAEGESEKGKRLVIDTVLNRVDSRYFPDSIHDVIYEKNQFTSMWNGRFKKVQATDETIELVKEELRSRTNSKVVYFTAGKFGKFGHHMFSIGNHYFSSY